jgi:hypothetical protein
MNWNYRVLKVYDREHDSYYYTIIEVFYDQAGRIEGWVKNTQPTRWEDYEGLRQTILEHLPVAFQQPVLIEVENEKLVECAD